MGTKKILQLPAIFIFVSGATSVTTMWHFTSSKKKNKIMGFIRFWILDFGFRIALAKGMEQRA
jgi:hypothetical protein